jgi:type IV secretion system protein VirB10
MSDQVPQDPRGLAPTNGSRRGKWVKAKWYGIVGASVAGLLFSIWLFMPPREKQQEPYKQAPRASRGEYDPPKAVVERVVAKPPVAAPQAAPAIADVQPPSFKEQMVGAQPPAGNARTVYSYSVSQVPEYMKPKAAVAGEGGGGAERKDTPTHVAYKGTAVVGGKSGTMPDRNLVLMPGVLRCTMATAINSDLEGPFICNLPGDVMSPTGVVLMEKGTQIVGSYSSKVSTGQKRLMTVAGTAYTPNGVVVPLGTPMADSLGRTGLEGDVDRHLMERFGGAIALSLVDMAFGLGQASLSKGGNTYLSFSNGNGVSSLAQEVLRSQIDIKPTITVNQGQDVALWIVVPIDFSASYRLEAVR